MTDNNTIDGEVELDTDPAAEAFTRLEREMALMRRAVEHLASERADIVIPDYGATLAEMAKRLGAVSCGIATIAEQPAMQLTPDTMAARIEAVALAARRADHDQIIQARQDLGHAAQDMRAVVGTALTANEQNRRSWMKAGIGLFAGVVLWSFLPGTIARSAPESWHWPERMAARMLGEPTVLDAGVRLIRSQNPQAWADMLDAARLERANHDIIKRCKAKAVREKSLVGCSLRVGT